MSTVIHNYFPPRRAKVRARARDARTKYSDQIEQVEIDLAKAQRQGLREDVRKLTTKLNELYAAEKRGDRAADATLEINLKSDSGMRLTVSRQVFSRNTASENEERRAAEKEVNADPSHKKYGPWTVTGSRFVGDRASRDDDPNFAAGYRMAMNGWPEGSVKSKASALGGAGGEQVMAGYAAAKAKFSQTGRRDSRDVSFEQGLKENEPRIVTGVKGMQNKSFSKRFANAAAMERWLESDDAGDYEVYQIKRA